jgi:hypothetical protein
MPCRRQAALLRRVTVFDIKSSVIIQNDSTTNGKNTSAPSAVVNAMFQFSNKYPMMAKFLVTLVPANGQRVAGISSVANKPAFNVYPNPTSASLTIELDNNMQSPPVFSIYNMQGALVKQMVSNSFTKSVSIDVSDLQAGNYFVHLQGSTDYVIICKQ